MNPVSWWCVDLVDFSEDNLLERRGFTWYGGGAVTNSAGMLEVVTNSMGLSRDWLLTMFEESLVVIRHW